MFKIIVVAFLLTAVFTDLDATSEPVTFCNSDSDCESWTCCHEEETNYEHSGICRIYMDEGSSCFHNPNYLPHCGCAPGLTCVDNPDHPDVDMMFGRHKVCRQL